MNPHDLEDAFWEKERKDSRRMRRQAIKKDRSKYKKSDFEKFQEELRQNILSKMDPSTLKKGCVTSIRSEGIIVYSEGKEWLSQLRGLLKKEKTQSKNLVAVGDEVLFEPLPNQEGSIAYIEERRSELSRKETLSQKKQQLIAVNVDLLFITASVVRPELKPTLIDRYIIAAEKGGLHPIVLINKVDLLKEHEDPYFEAFLEGHQAAGIEVLPISTVTGEGMETLKMRMKNRSSVFSGQSGVGKTSLINLLTGLDLRIGDVVERTYKGSHTTTMATLLPLPFGGFVIDTPGIRSFGVWDLSQEELQYYFPEFEPFRSLCKFPSCTHLHEPDCAVIDAVEKEEISALRYASYAQLYEEIKSEHLRR